MATMKVLGGKRSGYLTPDPFVLSQIDTSGKTEDAGMDVPAESGCETPKFVREVNVEDLQSKLESLQIEKESLGYFSLGPPPGLSNSSLDTEVMKVTMSTSLPPPYQRFGAAPPPPVPHPEFQFVRKNRVPAPQAKLVKSTITSEQVVSKGSVGHPNKCAPACRYVKRKGGCRDGADCLNCHHCFWSKAHTKGEEESLAQSEGNDARMEEAKTLANRLVSLLGGEEPFGAKAQEAIKPETSIRPASMGTMGYPHTRAEPFEYGNRMQGQAYTDTWPRSSVQKVDAKAQSFFGTSYGEVAQVVAAQNVWEPGSAINHDAPVLNPYAAPIFSTIPEWLQPQAFPKPQGEPKKMPWCASRGSMGHPYSCAPACKYAMKGKGCKDGAMCDHCHLCRWMRYGS